MRFVADKQFVGEAVSLDGTAFDGCTFTDCRLVFAAEDSVTFNRCTFVDCNWVFDGAAERTLLYLTALYQGLRPEGSQLVEALFETIRRGRVGEEITLPSRALAR
jgi:hypothetical protein